MAFFTQINIMLSLLICKYNLFFDNKISYDFYSLCDNKIHIIELRAFFFWFFFGLFE